MTIYMQIQLNSKKNHIIIDKKQTINLLFSKNDIWIKLDDYLNLLKYSFINFILENGLIEQKKNLIINYNNDNDSEDYYTNYVGLYIILSNYEKFDKLLYKYNFNLMSKLVIPKLRKYKNYKIREYKKIKYNTINENLSDTSDVVSDTL